MLLARRHDTDRRGAPYQVMLCLPARRLLVRTTFTDPEELLDLDLAGILRGGPRESWEEVAEPVYGVCTHGRHDACCAERGRPVCAALTTVRPEQTWEVTHVGGDRFAPNVVVLPEGLYYGRLDPESVVRVADLHEQGRLDLEHLRGRASYPMPAQYAEVALRRHLGEDRLDALRMFARDETTFDFRHGQETWRVAVVRTPGSEARLTCGAARLSQVPVFEVVALTRI